MDSFLLGLASFGLVLIPLVIIHELGHFIAAKLTGITVLEFGIGFPPRAAILFARGDTIYTLNWLPIGGFVRPYGEDFVRPKTEAELSNDRREIEQRGIKNPKSVFQATPWQRMFFMAAGPGINFVAALALFIIVALVGQPFSRFDVTVEEVNSGSVAAEAGLQPGDIIMEFNRKPVERADEFNTWVSDHANQPITLLVDRNGTQFETSLVGAAPEGAPVERVYIVSVFEDMPAYPAGMLPGDLIVAVDGIEVTGVEQLQGYTQAHEGIVIDVTILRGSERLDIPVAPKKNKDGEILMGVEIQGVEPAAIGLIAVNRDEETYTKALPPGTAIQTGVDEFVDMHVLMARFVRDLIEGDVSAGAARPVSPVGIGQIGGPIFEQTLNERQMYPIVLFAALISISLAITNLLPIPGLDGGRILFVVIELLRGKPMEPEREGLIHFIGVMLLLGIILIAVFADITHPINVEGLR
jgi:regulator of sigma E protease